MIALQTTYSGIDLNIYWGRWPAIVVWPKGVRNPSATVIARNTAFSATMDVSGMTESQMVRMRDILAQGGYSAEWYKGSVLFRQRPIFVVERRH